MNVSALFHEFFKNEKSSGLVLIVCTAVSLILSNSPLQFDYLHLWQYEFSGHSVTHWINDGLMAIFFLLIGLELEREVYAGELSKLKNALLPVIAAIGGMLVPAAIHYAFNAGTSTQAGAGIPMATDIAFALAVLSLVGNKVPVSLKVFLTALAVIDDLGAILVIAIFYTGTIAWFNLLVAMIVLIVMFILNRLKVKNLIPYLLLATAMWYFMLHSGVHATIAGVLSAFAIPFGNGDNKSASYVLQHFLHRPVAFLILPLFALANTAVPLPDDWIHAFVEVNNIGIFLGLVIGKPVGIFAFSYLSSVLDITRLPGGVTWSQILGTGFLGGIGFTMSIFITLLAFQSETIIDQSKLVILVSSLVAGAIGYLMLKIFIKKKPVHVR